MIDFNSPTLTAMATAFWSSVMAGATFKEAVIETASQFAAAMGEIYVQLPDVSAPIRAAAVEAVASGVMQKNAPMPAMLREGPDRASYKPTKKRRARKGGA
jgi:hypothetical protein